MASAFWRGTALGMVLMTAMGCQTALQPDPSRIAHWTAELRAEQTGRSRIAAYDWRGHKLVFVGARHSTDPDSPTFRLIGDVYALTNVDVLIAESFPYSLGDNPERMSAWLERQTETDGLVQGGETVPALRGAIAQGARYFGGEPDDSELLARLEAQGVSGEDVLGFYTLRTVPQWVRQERIDGPEDARLPALIEDELDYNRERLQLPASLLADYQSWAAWYARINGKPFGASFESEEAAPLADGAWPTNRISASIGLARDAFLLDIIATHLNAGDDVMVVFGSSHLAQVLPALDHMLGPPCYLGEEPQAASPGCLVGR